MNSPPPHLNSITSASISQQLHHHIVYHLSGLSLFSFPASLSSNCVFVRLQAAQSETVWQIPLCANVIINSYRKGAFVFWTDSMKWGFCKIQTGSLSQQVTVLLRWGRISLMGVPGCTVMSMSSSLFSFL